MDSKIRKSKGRPGKYFKQIVGAAIALVLLGFAVKVSSDYGLVDKIVYGPNAFIITAKNIRFKPENPVITASPGDVIRIVLRNRDYAWKHDLVIPELKLETTVLKGGEKAVLEFSPAHYGSFEFYCTRHQKSMKGIIRIKKSGL